VLTIASFYRWSPIQALNLYFAASSLPLPLTPPLFSRLRQKVCKR
jgi:hypothetical protein